jgi:hypothetical protein
MPIPATALSTATCEEAIDALLQRVRWYVTRGHDVPERVGLAFNQLADALGKPHNDPWSRVKLR